MLPLIRSIIDQNRELKPCWMRISPPEVHMEEHDKNGHNVNMIINVLSRIKLAKGPPKLRSKCRDE